MPRNLQLYDADTAAWSAVNAQLLRERRFEELAIEQFALMSSFTLDELQSDWLPE